MPVLLSTCVAFAFLTCNGRGLGSSKEARHTKKEKKRKKKSEKSISQNSADEEKKKPARLKV